MYILRVSEYNFPQQEDPIDPGKTTPSLHNDLPGASQKRTRFPYILVAFSARPSQKTRTKNVASEGLQSLFS